MLYRSVVQRDETGLNQIFEKAREFELENAMEAIISCNFDLRKVERVLSLVRVYQNILNIESSELVEFSENFIEQYATDNNKCFEIALKLVKKIGKTITGSMKLFRQFCPVVRRRLEGRNVVPTLDYTRLTSRLYQKDLFGYEPYVDSVKTLLQEMSAFFYHLVTTMKVCKDMIQKEQEVKGDYERLKRIFKKSCDEVLGSVNEVNATFQNVQLVTPEELEERRKNARPMSEWLPEDYHAHDKKWLRKEGFMLRAISGGEDGLDPIASQLWPDDHQKAKEVLKVLRQLPALGLPTRNTKTKGKAAQYESRPMAYLLKWSGVSHTDGEGKVVNEKRERRLYEYMQQKLKDDSIELPSWQAVCGSRKFCYDEKMTHQQMADAFSYYLPDDDGQLAKTAYLPFKHQKTADVF